MTDKRRYLTILSFFAPAFLLLFFWLLPASDPEAPLPLFHFYIVTFTTFVAVVVSILLSALLGPVARPRHVLAAVAFAIMGAIFFSHGLPTPGALIHHFHPAVQWSAWLTLFSGGLIFLLASFDGPGGMPAWLSVRRVAYLAATLTAFYFGLIIFVPEWFIQVNVSAAPWHHVVVFGVTLGLWLWAALRLWRTWRVSGDSVDGSLTLVAFWLAQATISMHQFPLWRLSWWLYHVLLLLGFLITVYVLTAKYEQARQFRLTPYYVAMALIITSLLALAASFLFAEFSVGLWREPSLELAEVVARSRMMGLFIAALTMGLLFVSLLWVVRRADKIIDARSKELAQSNADLRRSESIRQDLTNMIVHDLRTPLTTIKASLDLAARKPAGDDPATHMKFLHNARTAAARLNNMVDDILAVNQLEMGELQPRMETVEIRPLLERYLSGFNAQAVAEEKELTLEGPPELTARLDAQLMGRVVENLVSNAFKYTGPGGSIQVTAAEEGANLWISVRDDGEGIPDEYKEWIFGKYNQAPEKAEEPRRRGAGLGLAFCRLVVAAHGGEIWVEDAPGGGSDFRLRLPLNGDQDDESTRLANGR